MKKILLVTGKVVHVREKATKSGKKFYVFQLESETEYGRVLGNVYSWEKRDFKIGDDVKLLCFENNRIWKDKIYQDIVILSPQKEKDLLVKFGIQFNQTQNKLKV